MARFAPIAPLPVLERLRNAGVLGDYHFLLAHDVLAKQDEYREFYSNPLEHPFIIMDNGVVELGEAMPVLQVLEAARVVGANTMVLPDVPYDAKWTLAAIQDALGKLREISHPPLMAVVQGWSEEEAMEFLFELRHRPEIAYLSIPRLMSEVCGTRCRLTKFAVEEVRSNPGRRGVHLLGFSNDILDDMASASIPGVMGIDSAVPVRMGLAGEEIELGSETPRRTPGYLDNPYDGAKLFKAAMNISRVRGWLSG